MTRTKGRGRVRRLMSSERTVLPGGEGPDRWASLAAELLARAERAHRDGRPALAQQRVLEMQRAVRRSMSTRFVSTLQKRVARLRESQRSAASVRTIKPSAAAAQGESTQRTTKQAARTKAVPSPSVKKSTCFDCGKSGQVSTLTVKSGKPRCPKCHASWAKMTCSRCRRTWHRTAADGRRRLCDRCRQGDDPDRYTLSMGAPSLGRRR